MKQNIQEEWIKAPLGYELQLEVITEHRPCERHTSNGHKASIYKESKQQRDILAILKGEAQEAQRYTPAGKGSYLAPELLKMLDEETKRKTTA